MKKKDVNAIEDVCRQIENHLNFLLHRIEVLEKKVVAIENKLESENK